MIREVFDAGGLVARYDDQARTVTAGDGSTRPYTEEEEAAADDRLAQAAVLSDLLARVERIEAHLWPPDAEPGEGTTYPPFEGVWPAGGIITDGGTLYRNVSGVPLTTAPSGFPAGDWSHLYVEVTAGEPEPPAAPEWSPDATYIKGDLVTEGGIIYECQIPHGPEQQGMWKPGVAHSVWTVVTF